MDSHVHSSSSPPAHARIHTHTHIPSYICPLLRSYKDKEGRREGIRAIGKQAQRNREGIRDVLRCQTGGHEGTEVMVGRRVENDEQRAKHHREESRKEKKVSRK